MTHESFNTQMRRLTSQFGEKAYGEERWKLIWNEISDLSPEWFRKTVDEMIGNSRLAPLVSEFRDLARQERLKRAKERTKTQTNVYDLDKYRCEYCDNVGIYFSYNNHDPNRSPYVFRCHCSIGRRDSRQGIPFTTQWHIDEGYVWLDPKHMRHRGWPRVAMQIDRSTQQARKGEPNE